MLLVPRLLQTLYLTGATELGGPGGPWPPHLLENGLPPVTDWRTLPIKGLDD